MNVIFDLDGTLANIDHRAHFVRDDRRNWPAFFAACADDLPVPHVIASFKAHQAAGHRVRIWSGRSDVVRAETEAWLSDVAGIDPCFLEHMRAADDSTPDATLKRYWLQQADRRPDLVYDDRQRVVDMWRAEGVPCFQVVANWEDAASGRIVPWSGSGPLLRLMVGPSGAGKSTWARIKVHESAILSSDGLRIDYTGGFRDQSRNEDVFLALHRIAKARLSSGLHTTVDATNLRRRDRLALVSLAPIGAPIEYTVIDRPLAHKVADGGWRNDVMVGEKTLVEAHHDRFKSALKDILAGDGIPNVAVVDLRQGEAKTWRVAA